MTTTTIENQTTVAQTVTTQTVVTQAGTAPDAGLAMGSAFLDRIAAGTAKPGELMSLARQCKDNQIVDLLSVVEQRLVYLASEAYTNLLTEAIFKALPECLRMPDGTVPRIRKKPTPPVKTMTLVKDASGAITGAVMRTGS